MTSMFHEKRVLAIIPARGGSKRVPRKNIRLLCGKPLIYYAVDVARRTPAIDRTIVSTDDEEIRDIARRLGADVPFLRPVEIARDDTPDASVLKHALEVLEEQGEHFDYVFNLRPTTPFRMPEDVARALETAVMNHFPLVRSVTRARGVGHPYWMYRTVGARLEPLLPNIDIGRYYQSSRLPNDVVALNGVVDLFTAEHLRESATLYQADSMGFIEIPPERALDIDEERDLIVAEALMQHYGIHVRESN